MASGALNTKTLLLLLSPLVSSACSLWYSWDQHLLLGILADPKCKKQSNALLPEFFRQFFYVGVARVVGLLGVTTWASVGAICLHRPLLEQRGSLAWYSAAASLAVAHLFFIPGVAPPIKAIIAGDERAGADDEANVRQLRKWLGVNKVRTLTVDAAALVCSALAVVKTFSV